MVAPTAGAVVLVQFPFSDLSRSKLRPAVVLADVGRGVLCQVTSKLYGDSSALKLDEADFASGSLQITSYVRPGKRFTASTDLITAEVGMLKAEALTRIVDAVVGLLRPAQTSAPESQTHT